MEALSGTYKLRSLFYDVRKSPSAALAFPRGRQNHKKIPLPKTKQPSLIKPRNKLTLEFEHLLMLDRQFISVFESSASR